MLRNDFELADSTVKTRVHEGNASGAEPIGE